MVFAFLCLLMLCGAVGVVAWLAWQRLTTHMRSNPEAAKLVAEHVIAPLLMGPKKSEVEESPKGETVQLDTGLETLGKTILPSRSK